MTPLDAALALARRGFAPLPVRAKYPTNWHGVDHATDDPAQLPALFAQRSPGTDFLPPDGVGIACGRPLPGGGYLGVLDVDVKHDGPASLAELEACEGDLPATWSNSTPTGGWHLYFSTPSPTRPRIGFRPGLDWRGADSYVVALGRGYRARARHPIAAAPEWLLAIVSPPKPLSKLLDKTPTTPAPRYVERALELECQAVASAPEGCRNATLNKAAFSLARFIADGQADAASVVQLLAYAASRAGLPEREIGRTIGSALRSRGVTV